MTEFEAMARKHWEKYLPGLVRELKREKLVLDWRKTQATRAAVRVVIADKLDELPPLFVKDIYNRKCDAIYRHLFENYYGEGRSVYAS